MEENRPYHRDVLWQRRGGLRKEDAVDNISYILTRTGTRKAGAFIGECMALRKELLDAHKDTADETTLPTIEDILSDIEQAIRNSEVK